MKESNLVSSTSEAQRLINQNAVSINGKKVTDVHYKIEIKSKQEIVLKIGKKRFLRVSFLQETT